MQIPRRQGMQGLGMTTSGRRKACRRKAGRPYPVVLNTARWGCLRAREGAAVFAVSAVCPPACQQARLRRAGRVFYVSSRPEPTLKNRAAETAHSTGSLRLSPQGKQDGFCCQVVESAAIIKNRRNRPFDRAQGGFCFYLLENNRQINSRRNRKNRTNRRHSRGWGARSYPSAALGVSALRLGSGPSAALREAREQGSRWAGQGCPAEFFDNQTNSCACRRAA